MSYSSPVPRLNPKQRREAVEWLFDELYPGGTPPTLGWEKAWDTF